MRVRVLVAALLPASGEAAFNGTPLCGSCRARLVRIRRDPPGSIVERAELVALVSGSACGAAGRLDVLLGEVARIADPHVGRRGNSDSVRGSGRTGACAHPAVAMAVGDGVASVASPFSSCRVPNSIGSAILLLSISILLVSAAFKHARDAAM